MDPNSDFAHALGLKESWATPTKAQSRPRQPSPVPREVDGKQKKAGPKPVKYCPRELEQRAEQRRAELTTGKQASKQASKPLISLAGL